MRIPRLAFALLLATVFVLASNLVMGRVRAHTRGRVLMLMAKPAEATLCLVRSIHTGKRSCSFEQTEGAEGRRGAYTFRVISNDGDHVELGIRAAQIYRSLSKDEMKGCQKPSTIKPGETLHIDVPGAGNMEVKGELWDHYPSPGEVWDHVQSKPLPTAVNERESCGTNPDRGIIVLAQKLSKSGNYTH